MKLKIGDIIAIEFTDISSYDSWIDPLQAEVYEPIHVMTIGWVVSDDEKFIRLTTMWAVDGEENIVVIPKGCIDRIRKLKYVR